MDDRILTALQSHLMTMPFGTAEEKLQHLKAALETHLQLYRQEGNADGEAMYRRLAEATETARSVEDVEQTIMQWYGKTPHDLIHAQFEAHGEDRVRDWLHRAVESDPSDDEIQVRKRLAAQWLALSDENSLASRQAPDSPAKEDEEADEIIWETSRIDRIKEVLSGPMGWFVTFILIAIPFIFMIYFIDLFYLKILAQ
jgi:hypothetical protein